MTPRSRLAALWSRVRLTHKVALLSALPVALLGVALADRLDATFEDYMVDTATEVTAPASKAVSDFFTTPEDLEHGYPAEKLEMLDLVMAYYFDGHVLSYMRIVGADGTVLWAPEGRGIGERSDIPAPLRGALDGTPSGMVIGRDGIDVPDGVDLPDRSVAVAIPIVLPGDDAVLGHTELYVDYGPMAARMADHTRRIYILLAAGLVVLWVTLWPIVARASKRLRTQAEENQHLALHDTLTGLPNRTFFSSELTQAIRRASRVDGRLVGVLLLDLDRFKEVNDSLGHHQGDELLVQVADRLRGAVRAGDTVARLGGDEFGVVLHDLDDVDAATAAAERINRALDLPVELTGLQVQVEASVGIAVFPSDGDDANGLMQRADVAMYAAKALRTGWARYDAAVDPNSPHRLALVSQLRSAIDGGELVVHYQPVTSLESGETIAMEALVRWVHPVRGMVPPSDFIPAAESSGLIRPLSQFVLREALTRCRSWLDDGADVSVAVNLSARHVQDPRCADDVLTALVETGVPSDRLVIEITESAVLGDPGTALRVLTELREHGVRVALDDFGTGYSSLTQLKDLPVDEIKIDRSFVSQVGDNPTTSAIVRSIVELGGRLRMEVVAEGVEEQDELAVLQSIGCGLAQGYYFSPPLAPDAADDWVRLSIRV